MGTNITVVVGQAAQDPRIDTTEGGTLRASFSIPTHSRRKDAKGQRRTTWYRITAFGRTAEIVQEYVAKGTLVHVSGQAELNTWTGNDGQSHCENTLIADSLQLLGNNNNMGGDDAGRQQQQSQQRGAQARADDGDNINDLPF